MEWNRMYSIGRKCLCLAVVLMVFCTVGFAEPKHSTKGQYTKRGRACQSLRHLTKDQPHLRKRVQGALFEQREAEKVCRDTFRSRLPTVQPTPKAGSVCKALAEYRDDDPAIKVALKRARRLERRAHARCSRLIKRIRSEVPKTKAAGMR